MSMVFQSPMRWKIELISPGWRVPDDVLSQPPGFRIGDKELSRWPWRFP